MFTRMANIVYILIGILGNFSKYNLAYPRWGLQYCLMKCIGDSDFHNV